MSKLTHESMRPAKEDKKPAGQGPQTYVVDDATTAPAPEQNIDNRLAEFDAPEPEKTGAEFDLPPRKPISKTLEKLIFVGRISTEVEIDGAVFELSTLTNKEHGEIVRRMYRFAEAADLFIVRVLTLANAIKKIDGISLDDIDLDGSFEDDFHKRISIIDQLQLSVVEQLFEEYEKLVEDKTEAETEDKEIKN